MSTSISWAPVQAFTLNSSRPLRSNINICTSGRALLLVPKRPSNGECEIYKSDDNGNTWTLANQLTTGTNLIQAELATTKPNLAVLYAYDTANTQGRIYVSSDEGENFSHVASISNASSPYNYAAIAAFSTGIRRAEIAFGGTFSSASGENANNILISDDNCATWTNQNPIAPRADAFFCSCLRSLGSGKMLAGLFGSNEHFPSGEDVPMLYRSTDYGETWTPTAVTFLAEFDITSSINGLAALDANVCIALGNQNPSTAGTPFYAWRSSNGGSTWTRYATTDWSDMPSSRPYHSFGPIQRITGQCALAGLAPVAGSGSLPWRITTDAGLTWNTASAPSPGSLGANPISRGTMAVTKNGAVLMGLESGTFPNFTLTLYKGTIVC